MALNGETIQGLSAEDAQDEAFGIGTEPSAQGSCRQQGYDEATTPALETFNGLQSLLGDELEALDERFENDPRIREARAEWQTCMAAEGYTYERDEGAREEFQTLADDIGAA